MLRDVQHMSIIETAQVLGISEGLVKTRLLRARLQMRDALAPGIDLDHRQGRIQEGPSMVTHVFSNEPYSGVVNLMYGD